MAKPIVDTEAKQKEEEAFEIIELAIDDINLLARAFDVINEVCQQRDETQIQVESAPAPTKLH